MGDQTPDASVRTFADVMREQNLARERDNTMQVHTPLSALQNGQLLCSCYGRACNCLLYCHGSKKTRQSGWPAGAFC